MDSLSPTSIQTTKIFEGETKPHKDHYSKDDGRRLEVGQDVTEKVGFIVMNDNSDATFIHGDSKVTLDKSGMLVIFDGSMSHQTVVGNGQVHLAGPFLMRRSLDAVGTSSANGEPCAEDNDCSSDTCLCDIEDEIERRELEELELEVLDGSTPSFGNRYGRNNRGGGRRTRGTHVANKPRRLKSSKKCGKGGDGEEPMGTCVSSDCEDTKFFCSNCGEYGEDLGTKCCRSGAEDTCECDDYLPCDECRLDGGDGGTSCCVTESLISSVIECPTCQDLFKNDCDKCTDFQDMTCTPCCYSSDPIASSCANGCECGR